MCVFELRWRRESRARWNYSRAKCCYQSIVPMTRKVLIQHCCAYCIRLEERVCQRFLASFPLFHFEVWLFHAHPKRSVASAAGWPFNFAFEAAIKARTRHRAAVLSGMREYTAIKHVGEQVSSAHRSRSEMPARRYSFPHSCCCQPCAYPVDEEN